MEQGDSQGLACQHLTPGRLFPLHAEQSQALQHQSHKFQLPHPFLATDTLPALLPCPMSSTRPAHAAPATSSR